MLINNVLLKNRVADAAVGSLDVKHGAHGGCDVGHVGEARGFTRGNVPTHENQWYVAVALAPGAVVGPCLVGTAGIESSAGHDVDFTAAAREVAQFDALLEDGGQGVTVDVEDINRPFNFV